MAVLNLQVSASIDDAIWTGSGASGTSNATDFAGKLSNVSYNGWSRFTSVSGLAGAAIDDATFMLYGESTIGSSAQSRTRANDAESPGAFVNASDANGRAVTTAFANRSGSLVAGNWNDLDVESLIQELADSYDPTAIVLLEKDNGSPNNNLFAWRTYDFSSVLAPKLDIEYTVSNPGDLNVVEGAESIPDGSSTPRDFGDVEVSGSAPQKTFTIENLGDETISITSITVPDGYEIDGGSDLDGGADTIAGSSSKTLVVNLLTDTLGTFSGDIVINSDDPDEGTYNFAITGQVVPVPVDVDTLFDDPELLVSFMGYDSRSNRTLLVDPKANSTVTVFDGASRPTQVHEHLRQRGQGESPPADNTTFLAYGGATIRSVTSDYDGNGRVRRLVDDNGNQTLYQYDSLDRETQMEFTDGSTRDYVYNEAGDVTEYTDENGSEFDNTFDPLGRKTQCDITQASGVIGTDQQTFQYDGLSRMTFCRDSISSTDADVSLFYDSLSRVIEDSQVYGGNTRNATNEKFESHPMTQMAFPDGRQITNEYDLLYRRTLVEETSGGADIAAWEFFGPNRVAEVTLGNGLVCSHLNNARTRSAIQDGETTPAWGNQSSDRLGYDGAGRLITKRYLDGGIDGETGAYNNASAVVGQTTAYDKASNKLYERSLHVESRSNLYEPFDSNNEPTGGYDSINRLRQYQRGVLSSSGGPGNAGGGSVTTPISLPDTDNSRTYDLDGLGNWRRTTFEEVGESEETQIRQHNSLNQITSTKDGSDPGRFQLRRRAWRLQRQLGR